MALRLVTLLFILAASAPFGSADRPAPVLSLAPQDPTHSFDISSEASLYLVRGRLSGAYQLRRGHLKVIVDSGTVFAVQADPSISLRAIVANASQSGWARVGESAPQKLGAFGQNERRQLKTPLTLDLSLPKDFDPTGGWLVFEFATSEGHTTYACSDRNLAGPDSLSAARAELLKRFYPAAC